MNPEIGVKIYEYCVRVHNTPKGGKPYPKRLLQDLRMVLMNQLHQLEVELDTTKRGVPFLRVWGKRYVFENYRIVFFGKNQLWKIFYGPTGKELYKTHSQGHVIEWLAYHINGRNP